jgi:hypothetical protein
VFLSFSSESVRRVAASAGASGSVRASKAELLLSRLNFHPWLARATPRTIFFPARFCFGAAAAISFCLPPPPALMHRQRQSPLALALLRNVCLFRSPRLWPGPPQALHIDGTTSPPPFAPALSLFDLKPNGCTPLRFLLNKTHSRILFPCSLCLCRCDGAFIEIIGIDVIFLANFFMK